MRLLNTIACCLFLFLFTSHLKAQKSAEHELKIDIPEVALLALSAGGNDAINFTALSPNAAGQQLRLSKEQNSEIWINYSSIVSASQKRKVTATVVGEIPQGIVLKVLASESRGKGKGELGEPLRWATLSNSAVDIVSNIGSCYTGRGVHNGHLLSYDIELENKASSYQQLAQLESSLQILYTLTDDN